MARKRAKRKRKKGKRKIKANSAHASLCALAPLITGRQIFDHIHQEVKIPQKKVDYSPSDKLVFVVIGIMSGCEAVFDLNRQLRVDRPLLRSFGYEKCAEQSVTQDTLNAATEQNVQQLEAALKAIWDGNNLTVPLLEKAQKEDRIVTVDMDLSGMPASKKAEEAEKGYFAGKRNIYGRQLARALVPKTQEIVTESLYSGKKTSCKVFKGLVQKMEHTLSLETKAQRRLIRLRLDGGFGTDENINYALWRDYHLLVKMYSGNRAKVLAKSVQEWVDITPGPDNRPRQAGWVSTPHRFCRKTRQLAIRMPKKKGDGYKHSVLVTTDMNTDLHATVRDYDGRSGVPESTFCQDNQGLGNRKRRKRGFVAQQMLTLLNQLAHNLIRWMQNWLTKAMECIAKHSTSVSSETNSDDWWVPASDPIPSDTDLAIATLNSFGMKRFVRQVLCLSGVVVVRKGKVRQVKFNPLYPLISRIALAFEALLTPYGITVSLYEI
jgi:hypothetical protein